MAINTRAIEYRNQEAAWSKIDALMGGAALARVLVRPLPGQSFTDQAEFAARAYYLPALPRTVDLFGGLLFLRPPQIVRPDPLAAIFADVTMAGDSLEMMAGQVAKSVLTKSRCMVLVDMPQGGEGLTAAQAQAQDFRPYARIYRTEDILDAKFGRIGGAQVLRRVRVREVEIVEAADFTSSEIERVRVLELNDGGQYQQTVYTRTANGPWAASQPIIPQRRGAPLTRIPAFFFTHLDTSPASYRPVLADLADASEAHLQDSAAYQWGLLWTACPTPVFIGLQPPAVGEDGRAVGSQQGIRLGSSEGIALAEGGDAKFLEFSGQGLTALRQAMEDKRRDMGVLGARVLLDDPRQAIAAETAKIQRAGDHSTLSQIANVLSEGMTAVAREVAAWAGVEGDVSVSINRNFVPSGLSPQQIEALLKAWQSGALTIGDLFAQFKAADLVRADKTLDDHRDELELEALEPALTE